MIEDERVLSLKIRQSMCMCRSGGEGTARVRWFEGRSFFGFNVVIIRFGDNDVD